MMDHILFNQDDSKLAFLLRMLTPDSGVYSRVFYSGFKNIRVSVCSRHGMASHADWLNPRVFAIWGRKKSFVKKVQAFPAKRILRPVIMQLGEWCS